MPTNKYFKCPFCDKRLDRKKLVNHIASRHMDELPEDFTPLRATFHAANRKGLDYRPPCRICKNPTEWDEKKGRYDQLCKKQACHDAYVAKMKRDMGDRIGINRQTATAEGLEKMLAGRRISGKYKFQDGKEVTYTGSYELKALEFFDKVLNCKSEDIVCPGPVLQYELDGKMHYYITDMYYVPYDLIIEVKDGGDKPNTNPAFAETRRKVMAKERYIIEKTDYNYIRLTNNDFSQILNIFGDLKLAFNDDRLNNTKTRIIHANESTISEHMVGAIQAAMPPAVGKNDVVVVNYMKNNVFSRPRIAVADNLKFDTIFKQDEYTGIVEETDKSFLENCKYDVYIAHDVKNTVSDAIKEALGTIQSPHFFYDSVFGHYEYTPGQIEYESNITPVVDYYQNLLMLEEEVRDEILSEGAATPAKVSKIEELNKTLNDYEYGMVVNGRPVHDLTAVKPEEYMTIPAAEFEHYKLGTCWDFVNYEAEALRKMGITYKCYFAIMGEEGRKVTPTHTFITFKDKDGNVFWFESSWGGNKGVRSYSDEKALLEDFVSRFTKRRSKWREVDIYEYRPGSKYVNISSADFINKITTENKMIKQVFNKGGNPNG